MTTAIKTDLSKLSRKTKIKKVELTKAELKLISQVLFNSRWSGQEWQQTITPLINKIAKIIDNR